MDYQSTSNPYMYSYEIAGLGKGDFRLDAPFVGSLPQELIEVIYMNYEMAEKDVRDRLGEIPEDVKLVLVAMITARALAVALHGQTIEVDADDSEEGLDEAQPSL